MPNTAVIGDNRSRLLMRRRAEAENVSPLRVHSAAVQSTATECARGLDRLLMTTDGNVFWRDL